MSRQSGVFLLSLIFGLLSSSYAQSATPHSPTPFAPQFGNGCQTQIICAAIERLGLYAGLRLDGTVSDAGSRRELGFGSRVSVGLDLLHRVALEVSFPAGVIYRGVESTLLLAGPLQVGARLRLGGAVPTLFSERKQPHWALVLGAYVSVPLPHAAGDERHDTDLGVPQPDIQAAAEIGWGPVQVVPSLGLLFADQAVYLHAGGRVSLGISWSLRFDLEAQSRIPVHLPDSLNLCHGGARAGLGLRGVLKKGVLGSAHYDLGSGECEPAHRVLLGVTFAFGDEPLRRIPTPEEVGIPRLWLGIVDPILDCNGWMLDESTLLPKFKFGDPDPQDPNLIRRGAAVFRVGDHFDIDRSGRVYRPHQYVALADEQVFTEAKTAEKLALPVCEFGPKHRFFEHCQFLAKSLEKFADAVQALDAGHGAIAVPVREMQYEEECLGSEEQKDPRLMFMGLLSVFRARAKPDVRPPPPPPTRKAPGGMANDSPPPNLGKGQPPPTQASHLGVDEAQGKGLGDHIGDEGGRVAKNQSARLRRPADRHSALKVKQKTLAKEKNTVIEPGVDVQKDVDAINAGDAARTGETFTVNGRTYGLHDGTLYPISGTGFHQLERGAFKALGVLNEFGPTERAFSILEKMGISDAQRATALRVYEVIHP